MNWVWCQYEDEKGEVNHNLALVVAIVKSRPRKIHIILSWGKELPVTSGQEPQRVICSDEFWVVDKESIASAVIEEEVEGRVETRNSAEKTFSLDCHRILICASKQQVVRAVQPQSSSVLANLCQGFETIDVGKHSWKQATETVISDRKRRKTDTPPDDAATQGKGGSEESIFTRPGARVVVSPPPVPPRLPASSPARRFQPPSGPFTASSTEQISSTAARASLPVQLSSPIVPESHLDQQKHTAPSTSSTVRPCPSTTCTGACRLQIAGWPEHKYAQISEIWHGAMSIAAASSDETLCAWMKNLRLATLTTVDIASEQADQEVHTDVFLMSSETFDARQACGDIFKKPVIIQGSFTDSQRYTLPTYGERLEQCLGKIPIEVQGDEGLEKVDVSEFIEQLQEGQPRNALSLQDFARAIEPELVHSKRFQILLSLTSRANARSRQSAAKPVRYCDVDSCKNFNILGGRGAFSGAHVDALNGTWLRTLFGTKLWFVVPTESMDSEDWDNFGRDGASWHPDNKARAIPLGPDDVLLLPPGLCVIHAVLTTSPCLMQGGMIWDETCLPSILENLFWIGQHQKSTNEAMPYQIAEIIEELEIFVDVGRYSDDEKRAIASGIKKLRSLGCSCPRGRCSAKCVCLSRERRCTPLCGQHVPKTGSEWKCMVENHDVD
ncbi:hypothetical protein LTR62_001659 [Meristemomyces frigidus]|uniref:JmjC domain-containing protein n=1 Tax=Meristemomyces frigidus TaxID=1508187 RepID=A0AAN7T7U9_9PEZI|nr:hypothetical protein LTR62_001659 [Meristemomyces frigidus]